VKEVSKHFGGILALNQVSFTLESGSITSLIGPNGAGKTTLLNVLSGFSPPTSGQVRFEGQPIHTLPPYQVAGLGMARTFQNIRLFPAMTCLENVLAGQHLKARRPLWPLLFCLPSAPRVEQQYRGQALELLARVGLAEQAATVAQNLSYGQRRHLEIARALASQPRLLLLDEPVAGMRAQECRQMAELIRSLARAGLTILLVEHNMSFVMQLCTTITVLNFGHVITTGTPSDVARHPEVISAYLGMTNPSNMLGRNSPPN
jgi:branched-chain amino acid transport system ATP-binding protein